MATSSPIPLDRLLTHLEATLFSNNTNTNINTSAHRTRIATNLEHARALHLTQEKSLSTTRVPTTERRDLSEESSKQREWIRRLERRLREWAEQDQGHEDEEGESTDDDDLEKGEDLLAKYAPARKELQAGLDIGGQTSHAQDTRGEESEQQQQQQQQQQQSQPELRARRGLSSKDNRSAATTSAREELFASSSLKHSSQPTEDNGIPKTENLMSHNRTEQEALTTGLLGLARALKESSMNFSSSLEAERDVMKRAEGGLDKSAQGMEAAGQKMGTLRKMSEGQGWWGRMKLYALIFGLWVACFLLVFLGPKLRF